MCIRDRWNHPQTLKGSFSAVSTATIATIYSFCRDFRDLQDFHTFAPLRSQKFSEKPYKFLLEIFHFFRVFRWKFAIFLRNFDEILPEFHRNCLEMAKKLTLLKDWGKPKRLIFLKDWKKQKDWEKIKDWERLAAFLAAQNRFLPTSAKFEISQNFNWTGIAEYCLSRSVSYTHLTLPTICSV